jgi:hypothetical protein
MAKIRQQKNKSLLSSTRDFILFFRDWKVGEFSPQRKKLENLVEIAVEICRFV